MCYDSNRYEWARRAVRMQEEQLRAEQRKAEEKEAREKAKGDRKLSNASQIQHQPVVGHAHVRRQFGFQFRVA